MYLFIFILYEMIIYLLFNLMEKTTISNIETGVTKNCDILYKSIKKIELVIEGTTIKVILKKNNPLDKYYVGKISNMDFQSTGE